MTKKEYGFYARHEKLTEPIQGRMYAFSSFEVVRWVTNRVCKLTNTDKKELNAPSELLVRGLKN